MGEIDNTIASLNDLTTKTIKSGIEFQGFTKSLTQAAAGTEKASKQWTIFSRLVSGTPLWSIQNKLRAYLSILAGFETRSVEAAKAIKKQDKAFVDQMKGLKEVTKEYAALSGELDVFLAGSKTMAEFNETATGEGLKALENTVQYQKVLAATNDEQLAAASAMTVMASRKKELDKKEKQLIKTSKEAYAFDKSRIEVAKKIAKEEATLLKMSTEQGRKYIAKAGRKEEKQMKKDQEAALGGTTKLGGTGGGVTGKLMQRAVKGDKPLGETLKSNWKKTKKFFNIAEKMRARGLKIQRKGQKFAESVKPVMQMAFKYLVFGIMAFIGFAILAAFLYRAWGEFQSLGIMDTIIEFGSAFFEIIGLIFETVSAFMTDGVEGGLEKLIELGWAIAGFAWIAIKLTIKIAWGLIMATWKLAADFLYDILFNPDFRAKVFSFLGKTALFLVAAFAVKYFAGVLLTLAGIYALPIIVVGLLLAGVWAMAEWIVDKINPLASGGVTKQGLSMVGEKGPELVRLPTGSRVHSNGESKKLLSGGGGNTINVTINARDTSDTELRRIADKIGNMLNNSVNRRTSSGSMG